MAIRKILENSLAVVADGSQFDTLLFKSLFGSLQLHELRFAEGSPVGGAKKQQNRAAAPFQAFERLLISELIH